MKGNKYKILLGVLTVVFCLFLGCKKGETVYLTSMEEVENAEEAVTKSVKTIETEQATEAEETTVAEQVTVTGQVESSRQEQKIFVHICGAVENPGVYELTDSDRLYQAVEAAGGFTQEADIDYLNQAQKLTDGMKIYIPTTEEVLEAISNGGIQELGVAENLTDSGYIKEDSASEKSSDGRVNINIATEEELCTLPGIGTGKAQSIIDYRTEHGSYQTIEEIMNVEGIKEGLFKKIRDSITVS